MAQSNAAHEPSMEEILASIRRIIETTDGSEDDPGVESPEQTRHAPEPPPESVLDRVRENVANSQNPGSRPSVQAAVDQPVRSFPPQPLRQPAGQVSGEAEKGDSIKSRKPVSEAKELRSVSLAEVAARANSTADAKYPASSQVSEKAPTVRDDRQSPIMPEHNGMQEPKQQPPVHPAPGSHRSQALVSSEAGHRVSTSFEHLNKAVTDGPRRSFDEIAEEMLQPMLQEWLEDNLPLLVERLVREEIERLARGS